MSYFIILLENQEFHHLRFSEIRLFDLIKLFLPKTNLISFTLILIQE